MYKLGIVLTAVLAVALFAGPARAGLEDTATADAWSEADGTDPWGWSPTEDGTPANAIDDDSASTYYNSNWYDSSGATFTGSYGPTEGYPGWFELTWGSAVDSTGVDIQWDMDGESTYKADYTQIYLNSTTQGGTDGTLVGTIDSPAGNTSSASWSSTSTTRLTLYFRMDDGAGGGLDQTSDVRIAEMTVTPEPVTMALIGLGTLGTMLLRRRKSRK